MFRPHRFVTLVALSLPIGAAVPAQEPAAFQVLGSQVLFADGTFEHGIEPWVTDGTPEGTRMLGDLCPGPCNTGPLWVIGRTGQDHRHILQSSLGFLWATDGTPGGTVKLPDPSAPASPFVVPLGTLADAGLFLYGMVYDEGQTRELWATDGTPAGTRRLRQGISEFGASATLDGRIYFPARDWTVPDHPRHLFRTDGTPGGTEVWVEEIGPGPSGAVAVDGAVLFLADLDAAGSELWRTQGIEGDQARVTDLNPGPGDIAFAGPVRTVGGRAVFGTVPEGFWASDGTAGGTVRLTEASVAAHWLSTRRATPSGDRLFFPADDGVHGVEPWVTDGSVAGTHMVEDVWPGPGSSMIGNAFESIPSPAPGGIVFLAVDPEHELVPQPWYSDGTAAGTRMIWDACPSSTCTLQTVAAERVLYLYRWTPDPGAFHQLFAWRPGDPAPTLVAEAPPAADVSFDAAPIGDDLVFRWSDPAHGVEPWISDGTPAGTHLLVDLDDDVPFPPSSVWLTSAEVPDFRFQVIVTTQAGEKRVMFPAPECIPETVCGAGALPDRAEVLLRVVGPKPNGYFWPTIVKFSTSQLDVWVERISTGERRYYRLDGARPGFDVLPGLFDRNGFAALGDSVVASTRRREPLALGELATRAAEPPPSDDWLTAPALPGFSFQVRVTTQAGDHPEVRVEADCLAETACVSAALPGRSELFLRVVGPKPNGRLWPTLVRLSTSTLEVWIRQDATGEVEHYRLPGTTPGDDSLDGLFDREGFLP